MRMRGRVPAKYVGRYESVFHGNKFATVQSPTMPLRKEATATRVQLCVRPTQACVYARNAKKKLKVGTDTEVVKALKENNDSLAAALGELLQATVLHIS